MHMADALVSPEVAAAAGVASVGLLAAAVNQVKKHSDNENLVAMMGVMGAFIFAAQMINFSIPATGSSGHIVGGILLAALLGPWAAFITLASVLVVQCLVFADGGLMALGCNLLNMGACSTLVGYPLIFRPIAGDCRSTWRVTAAAVSASIISLELGALLVTLETELSGVTALPFRSFLGLMTGIHLLIGLGEGIATAAVLYFVLRYRPSLLRGVASGTPRQTEPHTARSVMAWFLGGAIVLGGTFIWIASSAPDGLEWSIGKLTGSADIESTGGTVADRLAGVQQATSFLPDYDSTWSGIVGCIIVVALVWGVCSIATAASRRRNSRQP